jgi:uridylate kinase
VENVPALAAVSITPIVRVEGWTYVAVSMSDVLTLKLLVIDFLAVSDAEDQHEQAVIFDLRDEPVVTYAVFPKLSKP